MKNKLQLFYFLSMLFVVANVQAQKSDVGNWFSYLGDQKINNHWNWHNEVQYRNFNFTGDTEQLLLRTGIGYDLSENNNNILLGYAYIYSEPYIAGTDNKSKVIEHRIFQQFTTKQVFGRVNIRHRYRFEQRFIDEDFKMRLRYSFSLNIPINKKTLDKNAVYVSVYNEIFISTEDKPTFFDRNRIYGGIGYCFNKNIKLELGLMSQIFQDASNRAQFQIAVLNNLPF